jgi:hypothetical protein
VLDIATDSARWLGGRVVAVAPIMGQSRIIEDSAAFVARWLHNPWPGRSMTPRGYIANADLLGRFWTANQHPAALPRSPLAAPLQAPGSPVPPGNVGYLLQISRLGISKGGDSALVSLTYDCEGLCGTGEFWLLTRTDAGRRRTLLLMSRDH